VKDLRKFLIDVRQYEAALKGSEYELRDHYIYAKKKESIITELEGEDSPLVINVNNFYRS